MLVLGIETSCDDTGIALCNEQGLLAHKVCSQNVTHAPYGGVVPELASRDHIKKILPLLNDVLTEAKVTADQVSAIAYTKGPGLHGPLLVGASFAKALSYAWGVPSVGIHHLEGHLLASMLEDEKPKFPFLCLLVSGGHSMLIKVAELGNYQIIGECLDDAAGEAFDKIAKLLELGYPGGPEIEKLAKQGNPERYDFPLPLTKRISLDFSFSGLKTHTITIFKENGVSDKQAKADIAAGFQTAVIDTIYKKCAWALEETKLQQLVIAGGVGANQELRRKLNALTEDSDNEIKVFFPKPEFCTDNGAMIAYAGLQHLKHEKIDIDLTIEPHSRLALN